jgi:regulator of protease activity HflC (stomatin/prohibitin superfamily)
LRVRQNEVAYVTRFGQVLNAQADPRQPVLHFKLPMAVAADTICISTDTVKMPVMTAFTRDTQEVSLQLSLTYMCRQPRRSRGQRRHFSQS